MELVFPSLRLYDIHSLDPPTFLRHLKHYTSALRRLGMKYKDFDVRPEETSTPNTNFRPIFPPSLVSKSFASADALLAGEIRKSVRRQKFL